MKMENTGWESFAEEDKNVGGLTFGYRAPANIKILQNLPSESVLLEVRNFDGSFCRLTNLENKDSEKFAQDQWLAVLDSKPLVGPINKNFRTFEKVLEKKMDRPLPDNRFDQFVDWTSPQAWQKEKRGYSLDISHLSSEKKESLIANFSTYGGLFKDGRLSITLPEWVKTLEFEWKMAKKQKLLNAQKMRIPTR